MNIQFILNLTCRKIKFRINLTKGGEKLKEFNKLVGYRNRCGLSQKVLGRHIGITGESYGRKENGKAPFTREEMKTIHTVLETELNEPISFTELFNI